jgi:hypothetical protein
MVIFFPPFMPLEATYDIEVVSSSHFTLIMCLACDEIFCVCALRHFNVSSIWMQRKMLKAVLEMQATQGEMLLILRQLDMSAKKKEKESHVSPASPKAATHVPQAASSSSPRLLSPPSSFQLQREIHDAHTRINDLQSEIRRLKSSSEARISELEFEVKKVKILFDVKHRGTPTPQQHPHEASVNVLSAKSKESTSPPKHGLKVKCCVCGSQVVTAVHGA